MAEHPLLIFAVDSANPPLNILFDALVLEGYSVSFSLGISGEANSKELASPEWEAAFLRWQKPEIHEVLLLERLDFEEEECQALLSSFKKKVSRHEDEVGKRIVLNHFENTKAIYAVQILPTLIQDEDHAAWDALELLMRTLALQVGGLIYAEAEGFCDAEGELLLSE